MAHYAFLDENNIVTEVIVGKDESNFDWERYYTDSGQHKLGGTPFRKNAAAIGHRYDEERDAFIPPQPYSSWTLNEETCIWDPPIPHPKDGRFLKWSEDELNWIE
jgi:hypothetical protein